MSASKLFRVTDAAQKVGLSRQRLWLYINDGRCKTQDVAGVCMVSAEEITRFAKSLKQGGRPKNGKVRSSKSKVKK